jgi:hypothetical protein
MAEGCSNHARTEERLERLEKHVEHLMTSTHRSDIWQAETDLKLNNLSEKFDKMDYKFTQMFTELDKKIQAITDKPTKRLDMVINTAITVLTSTGVALLITQLMK